MNKERCAVRVWAVWFFVWLGILGCLREPLEVPAELVLFDFETEADLDRMHWQCFTLFSLVEEYAGRGKQSLRMALHPSPYPGWSAKLDRNDWRGFMALAFDIYNPREVSVPLTVRIDDRKDYPGYEDRYNQRFVLAPGANGVVIPLDALVTSDGRRVLDLGSIYRFMMFLVSPVEVHVLYLDNVRLVGEG
ncbi:hypothetical protein [Desulfatitalea alkaliphila]|uniref:Lipoprotein n=1 Tax=Desulfatitalea alkaliphila TaxID=2929485 RepID=A0AA41US85_9BACT|nr:hypothetical protein [Desulfatitalea alkaliphila]MCJ8503038.1 hypothetical protein [Desulfatitalea alkaliphila]